MDEQNRFPLCVDPCQITCPEYWLASAMKGSTRTTIWISLFNMHSWVIQRPISSINPSSWSSDFTRSSPRLNGLHSMSNLFTYIHNSTYLYSSDCSPPGSRDLVVKNGSIKNFHFNHLTIWPRAVCNLLCCKHMYTELYKNFLNLHLGKNAKSSLIIINYW